MELKEEVMMKTFSHETNVKEPEEWRKYTKFGAFVPPGDWLNILGPIVKREFGLHAMLTVTISSDLLRINVGITREGDNFRGLEFSLSYIPGNDHVLWSHGTWIYRDYRGKKFAYRLMKIKEYIARVQQCGAIMASVAASNNVERHILKKCDFEVVLTSINWIIFSKSIR